MLTWVVLAWRHLLKNRRRSLATLLAVALGSSAVCVLGGFTRYIFGTLEDALINARGGGHLQVVRAGAPLGDAPRPVELLLGQAELRAIEAAARRHPDVRLATAQMTIAGLISNGRESATFGAVGRVPSVYLEFRRRATGFLGSAPLFTGRELQDGRPSGVGLSSGLAARLGLGLGSAAVVLAPTVEGRMNALDVEVDQLFEAPSDTLNDKMLNVSLAFARSLAGTEGADGVNILLLRTRDTVRVRADLRRALREAGLPVEVRTWIESNPEYMKSRDMFGVIFGFVFAVVLVIVVLSVLNTVGMAVLERTREIGTLRALGLRRGGVVAMFATEGTLLGVAGTLLGVALTAGVRAGLRAADLHWLPPTYTAPIPLDFALVPEYLAGSVAVFSSLAMLAAVTPARRAARLPIPEALDHV